MNVTVRLQAQARQAAGTSAVALDLPAGASVARAVQALVERLPALARFVQTPALLLFRGDEQVAPADVLQDGDELTLLAPMAGGQR